MKYVIKNIKNNKYFQHQYVYMSGTRENEVFCSGIAKKFDTKEDAEEEIKNCLNENYEVVEL